MWHTEWVFVSEAEGAGVDLPVMQPYQDCFLVPRSDLQFFNMIHMDGFVGGKVDGKHA